MPDEIERSVSAIQARLNGSAGIIVSGNHISQPKGVADSASSTTSRDQAGWQRLTTVNGRAARPITSSASHQRIVSPISQPPDKLRHHLSDRLHEHTSMRKCWNLLQRRARHRDAAALIVGHVTGTFEIADIHIPTPYSRQEVRRCRGIVGTIERLHIRLARIHLIAIALLRFVAAPAHCTSGRPV